MSYLVWDSSLSIGIDVIDNQHRRIVDYLNELDVAHKNQDSDKVTEILMGLIDYTISHFAFEESLMDKAGYPISDSHKKVHEAFTSHVNKYKERHENGEDISRQLMSDLQIWLTNHIKNDDRDYTPYVQKVLNRGWIGKMLGKFFG